MEEQRQHDRRRTRRASEAQRSHREVEPFAVPPPIVAKLLHEHDLPPDPRH